MLTRFFFFFYAREADLFRRAVVSICPGISACERAVWNGDVPEAGSSKAVNDCENEVSYWSWRHKADSFRAEVDGQVDCNENLEIVN